MAEWLPPYLNKMVEKREIEYSKAQKDTLKKKKAYEFAVEYEALCKEKLDNAKKDAKKDEPKA